MSEENLKKKYQLTDNDIQEIQARGISLKEVEKQITQLERGTEYVQLHAPCTIGNGITQIGKTEAERLIEVFDLEVAEREICKFVPASGAASRMFKNLEEFMNSGISISDSSEEVKEFFNNLKKFAFYEDLERKLETADKSIQSLISEKKFKEILKVLLKPEGLNYSANPKALIKFHSYQQESKTAFDEQVYESEKYIVDKHGNVNLHFTIPPEFEEKFLAEKKRLIEESSQKNINLNISFSYQKKSTDTIALDHDGRLFKVDGKMLFRPGGHGALIENLNDLHADVIFIKNIDNVQKRENLDLTIRNKKILGGTLVELQSRIHYYLRKLESDSSNNFIDEIEKFITQELGIKLGDHSSKAEYFIELLNRPVRVCGVVENEGHPGGGPFWVKDKNGRITRQIIESDQVNKSEPDQKEIFEASTHFNPVDLACGVNNYKGEKFNLTDFVDHSMVFVANKSKHGKELKALELPGLWNGAMAGWLTIFVEVPKETFTPVKVVNDLLNDYHQ